MTLVIVKMLQNTLQFSDILRRLGMDYERAMFGMKISDARYLFPHHKASRFPKMRICE